MRKEEEGRKKKKKGRRGRKKSCSVCSTKRDGWFCQEKKVRLRPKWTAGPTCLGYGSVSLVKQKQRKENKNPKAHHVGRRKTSFAASKDWGILNLAAWSRCGRHTLVAELRYLLWFSATALGIREDAALKERPPLQNNTPEAAWGLQIAGGKRVPPQPASLCRSQAWPCSKLHGKTCSTMSKWLWILLHFLHKYFLLLTDLLFSVFSSHKSTL